MFFSTLSTITLAFAALTTALPADPAPAGNATSAQKIGFSGTLSSLDGGLGGTVTVIDPLTLQVSNYQLEDASAPALYWWGATDDRLTGGFRISNKQVTQRAAGETLSITLDAGKSTEDFTTVGLYCERFSVVFGQTMLSEKGAAAPAPAGGNGSPAAGSAPKPGAGPANRVSVGAVGALAGAALFAMMMV